MTSDSSKHTLLSISGLLVILFYCGLMLVSWAFYPEPFAPWTNYLSRLGDFNYSPFGAYFYNSACILAGIALIPFFFGLRRWYSMHKVAKGILIVGQVLGFFAAFALISIGIFSEDKGSPHILASSVFFILNFFVLLLVNIALLFHSRFMKLIGLYGIAMTLISLLLEIFISGPLIEWYTVFGSLIFVGLLAYNTEIVSRQRLTQSMT